MKRFVLFLILFVAPTILFAQTITWTEIPKGSLPAGAKLFKGERSSPALQAWYVKVDMKDTTITIRPYISTIAGGKEGVAPFVHRVGAFAGVNGGYFDIAGSTSYSAVVYPNEVKAQTVASVVRSSVSYPVTRSFFGLSTSKQMGIRWIYHFGNLVRDIFTFVQPLPNAPGSPAPPPDTTQGTRYANLLAGIGGGPTLVKNGQPDISYDPEVFWGSGVSLSTPDPRTAVGYTSDGHAILFAADGRSALSAGVSLTELAQIMVDLGCVEAMNLDGGGSTQMAVGDSLINLPEGGTSMRPVPTILAVVRAESLQVPRELVYQKIIDTGDPDCTLLGAGWFPSANPGYWGSTPAQLNPRGSGDAFARFKVNVPAPALYDVYGWWVASSNRCTDTPFIIRHVGVADTVRMNQVQSGSQWKLIGSYSFSGDTSEAVIVSNAATAGSYVVADAIRLTSYDSITVGVPGQMVQVAPGFELLQNYPNPFNPNTEIGYRLPAGRAGVQGTGYVTLKVYDLLGRQVAVLVNERKEPGSYTVRFDARLPGGQAGSLASGVYFYRLEAGNCVETKKLILLR